MLNFKNVNIVTILLIIAVVAGHFILNFSLLWLVPIILVWFTLTAIGSFHIGWNYHLESLLSNLDTKKQQVAITFDDGPHPEFTQKVLELLHQYNAKATFFCIGKNIEKHPKLLKKIIADGHTVGNHTFSHTNNFGFLSTLKVIDELHRTNAIIKEISGFQSKLYRPAFGVTNPRIKKALRQTKLLSIGWNQRSLDTTSLSEEKILKRITTNHKKGDVILLHDTSEKSVRVLEQYLLFLQQNKTASVTIDTLFNIEPYA